MSRWLIALLVFVVWFVLMENKNRKERPYFEKVERENPELLEGRFQGNPVLRRRFMRALVRYCYSDGFDKIAFAFAQRAANQAKKNEDRASCVILMALNLEENESYAEAIALYDEALSLEPDNMTALSRKARALGIIQEEDCVEAFEEVIRREPAKAIWRNNYGLALLRIKRFEEAAVQLKKAIELDENLLSSRELLAMAYAAAGEDELMEAAVADAVAHGSDREKILQSIGDFRKNIMEEDE